MSGRVVAVLAGLSMLCAGRAHAGEPAPAVTSPASGPPRWLQAMAFVGVHQHMDGTDAQYYDPGLRLGAIAGWRATEFLSVNVQGLADQVHTASRLALTPHWVREASLAPLVHFRHNELDFVFGPRLGLWFMAAKRDAPFDGTEHRRGWTLGTNAGLMLRTRVGLSLGLLFDIHTREGTRSCVTGPGGPESCLAGWRSTENMFAVSFAAVSSPR